MIRTWLCAALLCGLARAAPEAKVLEIRTAFSWSGLAPQWFGYDYAFQCDSGAATCRARGANWTQRWENNTTKRRPSCQVPEASVPINAVQDLYRASLQHLEAVKEPVQQITHTDDYPHFTVTLKTTTGTTLLSNTSNGDNPPWNVQRGGQWFVQRTGEIARAYDGLMKRLPCPKQ